MATAKAQDSTTPAPKAPAWGARVPRGAKRAQLGEDSLTLIEAPKLVAVTSAATLLQSVLDAPLLLIWPADLYLAQSAQALAWIDESGTDVFVSNPDGVGVAYPVRLRDEASFRAWLDEARPARLRVIEREDGFELQTSLGKLPGPDPNGPSLPLLQGQLDIAGLRLALERLHDRFGALDEVCLVPSFGMEWRRIAAGLSGFYRAENEPIFEHLCLVYPRPQVP